jgi:hypothetical protein
MRRQNEEPGSLIDPLQPRGTEGRRAPNASQYWQSALLKNFAKLVPIGQLCSLKGRIRLAGSATL